MTAVAPLLAFLWASAKGYLAHVPLVDPSDNAQLNVRCERIRAKIREAHPSHQLQRETTPDLQANRPEG